jgi:hypothetical protein
MRIRSGVTLWLWIGILALVQQVAWRAIVYRWGVPSGAGGVSAWQLASMTVNIALSLGTVVAAWRILSPMPGRHTGFGRIDPANVVRALVVIALLVDLTHVALNWAGGVPVGLRILLLYLGLAWPLAGVGLLWHLHGLSQRIPRSTLPRLLKVSVYVYGGLTVLHLLRYLLLGLFIFPFCLPMEWVAFGVNGFVIFVLVRTRRALGQVTP